MKCCEINAHRLEVYRDPPGSPWAASASKEIV